jgi:hypothetical protein
LLSNSAVWPSSEIALASTMRAVTSLGPPGPNGMMIRTCFSGHAFWARTTCGARRAAAADAAMKRRRPRDCFSIILFLTPTHLVVARP